MAAFRSSAAHTVLLLVAALGAAWALALGVGPARAQDHGKLAFVEGTVEMRDLVTEDEGKLADFSPFDVTANQINGTWWHPEAIGGIEIRVTADGLRGGGWGEWIYDCISTFKQVGRGLHVHFEVHHEYGTTDLDFLLPDVFASDAPIAVLAKQGPVSYP